MEAEAVVMYLQAKGCRQPLKAAGAWKEFSWTPSERSSPDDVRTKIVLRIICLSCKMMAFT